MCNEASMSSPEVVEKIYLQWHSATFCITDYRCGLVAVAFGLKSLSALNRSWELSFEMSVLLNLGYIFALVVGLFPTFSFPWHKRDLYISKRESFLLHSCCWIVARFLLALYIAVTTADSHRTFATRALFSGPFAPVFLIGMGYPLRVQVAFPLTCVVGISATAGASYVHSQLLSSNETLLHLEVLSDNICSVGYLNGFVSTLSGSPCSAQNALMCIWSTQATIAVFLMIYYIINEEKRRRKVFFAESNLREPFPIFWEAFWFWLGIPYLLPILCLEFLLLMQ